MNTSYILTIFLWIIIQINLNSQSPVYFEFPTDTSKWTQSINLSGFNPGGSQEIVVDHYLLGDTILNGINYHKIYGRQIYPTVLNANGVITNNLYFVGGLREDSLKKIYFYCSTNSNALSYDNSFENFEFGEEYLLYDFNVNEGDTLAWIPNNLPRIVHRIDTIEIFDNEYREKIIFRDSSIILVGNYWISGIGSSIGLFGPYKRISTTYFNPRLLCFRSPNQSIVLSDLTNINEYLNCEFYYNDLTTSINHQDEVDKNSFIKINPNPFTDVLNISSKIVSRSYDLEIYNLNSQMVFSQNNIFGDIEINLKKLPKGIYIVKLLTEGNSTIIEKLIKQ